MNEACLNFLGVSMTNPEAIHFSIDILRFMREILKEFQSETGNMYNLEATPGEGTSYRLAKSDRQRYPDMILSGNGTPFLTNSTQLPVDATSDIF